MATAKKTPTKVDAEVADTNERLFDWQEELGYADPWWFKWRHAAQKLALFVLWTLCVAMWAGDRGADECVVSRAGVVETVDVGAKSTVSEKEFKPRSVSGVDRSDVNVVEIDRSGL